MLRFGDLQAKGNGMHGRYRMDFEDFERKVADNGVKLFLLCNPHNPVGRAWTRGELERVAEICERHGVIVASDEIHEDFARPGHEHVVYPGRTAAGAQAGRAREHLAALDRLLGPWLERRQTAAPCRGRGWAVARHGHDVRRRRIGVRAREHRLPALHARAGLRRSRPRVVLKEMTRYPYLSAHAPSARTRPRSASSCCGARRGPCPRGPRLSRGRRSDSHPPRRGARSRAPAPPR